MRTWYKEITTEERQQKDFRPLARTRGNSRLRTSLTRQSAEDDILRQAQSFTAGENVTKERKNVALRFARTRGNSRVRTSLSTPKNAQDNACAFFGAEDEIRTRATVSHTTPLAGEPLEPLGYFCIAQLKSLIQKAILLYHIFFTLSKLFRVKKKKSFFIFDAKFENQA